MTKKYIKRQLVLKELGIPINSDIQEYYDFFETQYGNISIHRFFSEEYENNDMLDTMVITSDGKDSNEIFGYFYKNLDSIEILNSSNLFENFKYMSNFSLENVEVLLEAFIRHRLNL